MIVSKSVLSEKGEKMKKKTKQRISAWAAGLLSVMLALQPLEVFAEDNQEQTPVSYQLTITKPDHGMISVESLNDDDIVSNEEGKIAYSVDAGEEVKLMISADEGYTVSSIEIKDEQQNDIAAEVTENGAVYAFDMPEKNVYVNSSMDAIATEPSEPSNEDQENSSEQEEEKKNEVPDPDTGNVNEPIEEDKNSSVDLEETEEVKEVDASTENSILGANLLNTALFASPRAAATITYLGPVAYKGVSVGKFLVNGGLAFCMEHQKTSPPTGTSFSEQIYNDANIRKVLYYGYGGPKQWPGFSGDEAQGIVVTTNALSYFYSGPGSLNGNPFLADNWLAPLGDFLRFVQSAPDISSAEMSLSKSYTESYLSDDKTYQRTENITYNSSAENKITIPLPADVTLVNVTTGAQGTGNVTVKGGDTFYLKAPLKMNGTWNSGNLYGSMGKFQSVLCVTGSSALQNLGQGRYGAVDPDHYVNLSVKWVQMGDIKITKFLGSDDELKAPATGAEFTLTHKETGEQVVITVDDTGTATTEDKDKYPIGRLIGGDWLVEETKTPEGFKTIDPFTVTVYGQGQVFAYIAEDKEIYAAIRVVKADESTGNVIAESRATFKIVDEDGNDMEFTDYSPSKVTFTEFTTDENGQFTLPERLPYGKYKLVEVQAPTGYLLCDPIEFTVDEMHDWETPVVLTAEDENVKGKLQLTKTDEETGEPVKGVEFEIIAAEDIVTGDGTLRASKGDVVDTVATDKDGKAESKELFLGKYVAKEVKTLPGYVLSQEEHPFELVYKDQNTELVYGSLDVKNKPTTIVITKKAQGKDRVLEGVKYNLWNEGMESEIDPEFTFKEIYTTDENGQIKLQYLAPGNYKIQEKETIPGYVLDDTVYKFTVDENGMIVLADAEEPAEEGNLTLENDFTKVSISKQDATTGKELPGAELELTNKDTGKLVEKWTSGEEPHYIEELPEGNYVLKEAIAPEGYKVSQDVEFKVASTGEVQKVVMKDEVKDGTIRTSMPNNFRSGSSTRGSTSGRVKTGDAVPIIALVFVMIIAAGVVVRMIWKRKRGGSENNA